ncbi:MAG: hypothetical protein JWM28_3380 [Chitinophagaceae bacterium]|nr:hypothetical protein [Chitinophagaceae bacterium]
MKKFRCLVPLFAVLLPLYVIMSSCKAGRPMRKILPDQSGGRRIEEKLWDRGDAGLNTDNNISAGLPFYASDTTINGKDFTAIYLRNPEFDSLAFGIIKSYEPFAGSLLKIIAEQGIKGVLIDFRQDPDIESGKANFLVANHGKQSLEAAQSSSVNIVFLWDELSFSRAAGFMNELKSSAFLAVQDLNNKNPFSPAYKNDCFSPDSPDFSE